MQLREICYNMKMKLRLVLHNIRSVYNVGAILRTAEGMGVQEVVFSGYTPRYNDAKSLPHLRAKLNRQIEKAALGAEQMAPQRTVDDLGSWLQAMRVDGWLVLGLENNLNAAEEKRKRWLGTLEQRAATGPMTGFGTGDGDGSESSTGFRVGASSDAEVILILGEEVAGIPEEIRSQCDYFLEIPMQGRKESFNVSVATGMALWELMKPELLAKVKAN